MRSGLVLVLDLYASSNLVLVLDLYVRSGVALVLDLNVRSGLVVVLDLYVCGFFYQDFLLRWLLFPMTLLLMLERLWYLCVWAMGSLMWTSLGAEMVRSSPTLLLFLSMKKTWLKEVESSDSPSFRSVVCSSILQEITIAQLPMECCLRVLLSSCQWKVSGTRSNDFSSLVAFMA